MVCQARHVRLTHPLSVNIQLICPLLLFMSLASSPHSLCTSSLLPTPGKPFCHTSLWFIHLCILEVLKCHPFPIRAFSPLLLPILTSLTSVVLSLHISLSLAQMSSSTLFSLVVSSPAISPSASHPQSSDLTVLTSMSFCLLVTEQRKENQS